MSTNENTNDENVDDKAKEENLKLNEGLLFYCFIKNLPKNYGLSIEATTIFGYLIKELEKQKSKSIDYKPYNIADSLNMSFKTAKKYIDELLATNNPLIKIENNKVCINRSEKEIKQMLKSGFCKMYTVLFDVFRLKTKYVLTYCLYCERQIISLNDDNNKDGSFVFQNRIMSKILKLKDEDTVKTICDKLIKIGLLTKNKINEKNNTFSLNINDITSTKVWNSVEKTGTTQWKKTSEKKSDEQEKKSGTIINNNIKESKEYINKELDIKVEIVNKELEVKKEEDLNNEHIAISTTAHMSGEKKEVNYYLLKNGYTKPGDESKFSIMDYYHRLKCSIIRKIFRYKINISCEEISKLDAYLYEKTNELNNKYSEVYDDKKIQLQYAIMNDIYEIYNNGTYELKALDLINPFLSKYEKALEREKDKQKKKEYKVEWRYL